MILYQSDLLKHKAIIHTNTKNSSFIRMAVVLSRMNITNSQFFLALLQPELQNVDPHDPNLTQDQIMKIMVEIKLNPWYFFREVLKIPISGGDVIPFQLHRGNLAAIWAFMNDIDFGLIQPRQTGKTYVTQSIMTYYLFVLAQHVTTAMVTKDTVLVNDNVQRLKELRDSLPPYMIQKSPRDWDRKEGVSYTLLGNYYRTATSPIDERSATKVLRGASVSALHMDELAFIQYNWILVPSIVNATLAASAQVRAQGIPAPIIYTTTAGSPDTKAGAYALSLFQSALPFSEKLYDLQNRDALLRLIEQTGCTKMLYLEFSYRQLGKSDDWFKDASTRTVQTQDDINRDLLNIWQSSTDKSVIPQHLLQKIRANKRDPNFIDYGDGFIVRWYVEREYVESPQFSNLSMIMGMDTSENVGRDYTTFVIIDPRDMKVLATCRSNLVNTMQVGKHVFALLMKYPKLLWIPERNNTGIGIIDYVMDQLQNANVNPFTRIYNEVVQNLDEPKYQKYNIYDYKEIFGNVRSTFGFRTTGVGASGGSRNILYKVTLMKGLDMNHSRLFDSNLISEICNLTEKNGRIDHPDGCHDDHIISLMLSYYLLYFGKHLDIYGIPASQVLEFVSSTGEEISPQVKNEQIQIRRRINELETLIATNPAHILKQSYLRELASLRPMLDDKLMTINPLARTQVKYQENQMGQQAGSSEASLRAFVNRYIRAR